MLSRLKPPGGLLSWYTALWALAAIPGVWIAFATGHVPWYVGLILFMATCAILIWFDLRPAGFVFGATIGLLAIVGAIGMFGLGNASVGSVARVLIYFHTAYEALQWSRKEEDDL